jgi:hypothetical protein
LIRQTLIDDPDKMTEAWLLGVPRAPRSLFCRTWVPTGTCRSRVAGLIRVRGGQVELPDSRDPVASQDGQRKLFGQGAGAGHTLCSLPGGIAVNLVSRGPQAINAVPIYNALLGYKLFNRDIV